MRKLDATGVIGPIGKISMETVTPRPNYEGPSWERMTPGSRRLVAAAAGFNNEYTLQRISVSPWNSLYQNERTSIFRVDWSAMIRCHERKLRQERKR